MPASQDLLPTARPVGGLGDLGTVPERRWGTPRTQFSVPLIWDVEERGNDLARVRPARYLNHRPSIPCEGGGSLIGCGHDDMD